MDSLTIRTENIPVDKQVIEAQKRWELDGTVTAKYLRYILGDISQGVSIFPAHIKKKVLSPQKECSR